MQDITTKLFRIKCFIKMIAAKQCNKLQ